jgi:MYXO-CTERM domain-containing protein
VGSGSTCDDGSACTVDSCAEATDTCTNALTDDACIIGGECVADGATHPAYPCLYCDPRAEPGDWSTRPEGTSCGAARCSGGRLVTAATCSTTGACLAGMPTRCAAGYCADETTCASTCVEGECPGTSFCAPSGVCELRRANASSCASDAECESGQCVDGICCSDACTGTCESCAVPGSIGSCVIVPAMTDPDGECGPAGYCDGVGGCVGGSDAGGPSPDAGAGVDASGPGLDASGADAGVVGPDAGGTPTPASGCGCRATGPAHGAPFLVLLGLAMLALRGRRRARRSEPRSVQ